MSTIFPWKRKQKQNFVCVVLLNVDFSGKMFLRKQFDKRTAVYRSSDSIENFRIRVSLRTLNTLISVPKYHHTTKTDPKTQQNGTDDDEIESHTLRWQEKRLSRKEIEFFADKANCQTDAQKEQHQTIKRYRLDDNDRLFDKIFTYVSEDSFHADGDDKKFSEFVQRVDDLEDESSSGELIISSGGRERLFKGLFGFETMYIMADLAVETVLFTIRWRSRDGLLIVYPDFNSMSTNPYLQEIDSDSKHMFHYALENLSEDFHCDENQVKKEIEVMSQLKTLSISTSPSAFHVPPTRCANVLLHLEIESAECFEYDNIHIRYSVVLPNCCTILDGLVKGSTHSCRKRSGQDRFSIGYCHEMMMLCNTDYQWNDSIKVTLDVISTDGWSRERSEGYTLLAIPLTPGMFQHELPCYRELTENTVMDKLKRYFIGGRRIVDHNTFNAISTAEKVTKLNRYGNETISSGILFAKHQILLQRNDSLIKASTTKNRVKNSTRKNLTIDDVVSAYHLAKVRLEAATSNK